MHSDDEVFWRKDGTSFPVEYNATPIIVDGKVDGAVVSFNDITKRLRDENSILLSEKKFRTIFDESPLGVGLIDSLTGQIEWLGRSRPLRNWKNRLLPR